MAINIVCAEPTNNVPTTNNIPKIFRDRTDERPKGWRMRGNSLSQEYHPDKAITDDYENYMKNLSSPAGPTVVFFYDDGTDSRVDGIYRHAVDIYTFFPHHEEKHYFLVYDKSDKRTKVTKFTIKSYFAQ